jgi:hypothetical protein
VTLTANDLRVGDVLLVHGRIDFKVVRVERTAHRILVFNADSDGLWFYPGDACTCTYREPEEVSGR